jgi:DNA-binding PadR family transcriptional regulator
MRHEHDEAGGQRPPMARTRRHDHAFAHPADDFLGDDPRFEGWRRGRGGHGRWGDGGGGRRHWDEGWGGPVRRGRGAIKAGVLLVLAEQPMHGYQLMQELSARSGGAWRPSPGAIYPTLQRLEDKGLVRSDDDEGRRVFSLTDTGRTVAERFAERGFKPWEVGAVDQERGDVRREVGSLVDAFRQVFRTGTPDQRRRALRLMGDTRRAVYRILAEDEPDADMAPAESPPSADEQPAAAAPTGEGEGPGQ